jgi:hypothetical protein
VHLALAGHARAFDEQELSACGCPGQGGDESGRGDALGHRLLARGRAQHLGDEVVIGVDPDFLAVCDAYGDVTAKCGDLLGELAHACFVRVLGDQAFDRLVADLELLGREPVLRELTRHEKRARDGDLVVARVPGDVDHLHAVEQRRRDRVLAVGGGHEQDRR